LRWYGILVHEQRALGLLSLDHQGGKMKSWVQKIVLATFGVTIILSGNAWAGAFAEAAAALESQINQLQSIVSAQQATIDSLTAQLAAIETNSLLDLGPYVRVDQSELNGVAGPHVIFDGVNVHVVSGSGETNGTPNGLGNLIVGYNEAPDVLLEGDRGGSHNLIMGREHKFLSNDSILHGWGSEARAHAVAIFAGDGTVSSSSYSAAIGGRNNIIDAGHGVTIGGFENRVSASYGVAVGGQNNVVTGMQATVTGGDSNTASGNYSSVSGGTEVQAVNDYSWAAGTLLE
jgi:hypothetical protein